MPHRDTTHEKNEQPYAEDAKDSQRTQRKPMDLLAFCVLCKISASSAFGGWRFPISDHSKPCLAGHHHHSREEPQIRRWRPPDLRQKLSFLKRFEQPAVHPAEAAVAHAQHMVARPRGLRDLPHHLVDAAGHLGARAQR